MGEDGIRSHDLLVGPGERPSGVEGMASQIEVLKALGSIDLFASLPPRALGGLAGQVRERSFPKGHTVIREGRAGSGYMYVIRDGQVSVSKLSKDGREMILDFLRPGDFFGEMSLLDGEPRSASVRTLCETRMFVLSEGALLRALRGSPELALALIRELSRRLREVDEQVGGLYFHDVGERTRRALLRVAQEQAPCPGFRITPELTHQQIAEMVGIHRETATRTLKALTNEGWLRREGKRYLVPHDR